MTRGAKSLEVWHLLRYVAVISCFMVGSLFVLAQTASGAEFTSRDLTMTDNVVGHVSDYKLSFSGQSGGMVQSVRLQLCSNDPFPGLPCTPPSGLDFQTASLTQQTGMTGFTISAGTTSNELILTRTSPAATIPGKVSFSFSTIHNPTTPGTIFGRLETFATNNASGLRHDGAGLAVAYLPSDLAIESCVPPYLLFCVGNTIQALDCDTAQGNYVDFGELSPQKTSTGQTQIVAATNADFGFTIAVQGTTMTSGTNALAALVSPDVSRQGTSQFGFNLRANSTPNIGKDPEGLGLSAVITPKYSQPNFYAFTSGDIIVQATNPDMQKYTASYVINIAKDQAPGVYVSTLTYIALASF